MTHDYCISGKLEKNKNLRHPWKTFAHVHNDVYNRATIVTHPQSES